VPVAERMNECVPNARRGGRLLTLNVVVEHAVLVLVAVKVGKGTLALEVLELDDEVGVCLLQRLHHLIHQRQHLLVAGALLAQAEVQRVLELVLVVRAHVEHDGQRGARVDAAGGDVQRELACGADKHVSESAEETECFFWTHQC